MGLRSASRKRENESRWDASAALQIPQHLKCSFRGSSYKLILEEPSKLHLTTRTVTSSLKPTSPQKFAALLKISIMRCSADSEEPRRTTAERRSVPNSSPRWFCASVMPSV